MATTTKKTARPKKAAKAKPEGYEPGKRSAASSPGAAPNFLISASNGLFLQSGSTGEIRQLTDEETAAVSKLLEKRQKLGRQLAELLQQQGFDVAPSIIWDGPAW